MHPNDFVPCLDRARCSDGRVDPTAHCCNNLHAFESTWGILGHVKLPEGEASAAEEERRLQRRRRGVCSGGGEASAAEEVKRETSLPERRLPLGETCLGSASHGLRQCGNERVDLGRRG